MTNTAEVKKVVSCGGCTHHDMCWMLRDIMLVVEGHEAFEAGVVERIKEALGSQCRNHYEFAEDCGEDVKFQIPEWLACEHLVTYDMYEAQETLCKACRAVRNMSTGLWGPPRQK